MKRPDLTIPMHNGKRFSWNGKRGCAEVSDLSCSSGETWGRVWYDAADVGFHVKSHRTGRVELFTLQAEHRDRDGDVTNWTFVAATDPTITIDILND